MADPATEEPTEEGAGGGSTSGAPRRPVVAVANRLPVEHGPDGWQLSPGGLVTALKPVMERGTGTWIGWDGGADDTPRSLPSMSIDLRPVSLDAEDVAGYYHGASNRMLWPLLHNAIERPVFDREWWRTYQAANAAFAAAAVDALRATPDALLWVHDYHLMLVPQLVRQALPQQRIGFFLHVPWPAPDLFVRLPWRTAVLRGLLGADVVSFHTEGYRRNFVQACGRLLAGEVTAGRGTELQHGGRPVLTTASPISIDAEALEATATAPDTAAEVARLEERFAGRTVLLGVDRLDYTKGITERLLAFELLLERREDLRRELVLVQIAVPSRDDVQEYRDLRVHVEQTVGRINGRFSEPGADVPVHYLYRGVPQAVLAAHYARADVMLVTPLIDGMNLVAKEWATVQRARRRAGVLVLSEFTGAALELRAATPCNPFDVEGLSARIEQALDQPAGERRRAIGAMARRVRAHDVHRWVDGQLAAIAGSG